MSTPSSTTRYLGSAGILVLGGAVLAWALFALPKGEAEGGATGLSPATVDAVLAALPKDAPAVAFSSEILPILSNQCFSCHGPDESSREAGLRLDQREVALERKAIVPGDARKSLVAMRITASDPGLRMPPATSHRKLNHEQIRLLVRWIEEGAEYGAHWAFVAPRRHAAPAGLPSWSAHEIDRFVAGRWKAKGLQPAPRANKETLLRRVHLDLVGLPPSSDARDQYLADEASGAYERMVDRVLAMPAYAEHWTSWWLDKARYADTMGYEKDPHRTMWPYRDWVLRAFLEDMPFDRFTRLQLAGDLESEPKKADLVATAFHRNTMNNQEGGTDDEEFRVAAVVDRSNTTMSVWMGLTWNCVQCHSHKYDPFTHEDYYRLFAVFNQTADSDKTDDRPTIQVGEKAGPKGNKVPIRLAVMRELPEGKRRETFVMRGGNFLSPDKERGVMEPGTPSALHPFPEGSKHDRSGLADWLLDPGNPLTARVQVNRVWARLFGRGIVTTLEDFGLQGARPSHPRLLDTLAHGWQTEQAWSLKKLLRHIVTSETYKQSAAAAPRPRAKDPDNTWLTRGPRHALEAEALRDQALFVAGLLSHKRFGPSVMPPQPEGVWMSVYSGARWRTSPGEDRYRRAVYTYWKRTSPYPSLQIYGTPSREVCQVARIRTNTPLQALVSLNDPVFVEAAEAFAARVAKEAGSDLDARIQRAFVLALARKATPQELVTLRAYHESTQSLMGVCSIILNLDEFLSKP